MPGIAALCISALGLSYLGVKWVRSWAERRSILSIPNVRSSHDRPMPHGGGLAIVAVTLAGFLLFAWLNPQWSWQAVLAYLMGAILVATVSWLDDLRSLPVVVRLIAHGFAAAIAIWGMGYWNSVTIPFLGATDLSWLGLLITFVWIVGLTNAYNFMDGIDGIAASQAVVAGLSWAVLGWLSDQPLVGMLGLLLASSSLGFLGHNWPPASIFMGDVGSAFLGYSLAVLPVIAAQGEPLLAGSGVLLVWPFIFDAIFTFSRRILNRENVLSAHHSHLYQRLITVGRSHRFVTLLYILLAMCGAVLAIAWLRWESILVVPAVIAMCLAMWAFVNHQERRVGSRS